VSDRTVKHDYQGFFIKEAKMYQVLLRVGSTSFVWLTCRKSARSLSRTDMKFRLTPLVITLFVLLSMLAMVSGQSTQNDAAALIAEAKLLLKKNDLEHALATIMRAISADPRNAGAYVQLALIHASMNDDDKARLAVEEALKIDPNYAPAHQQRAAQLRRARDYEGAIREAKLALSLKPDAEFSANSHLTLGLTYLALKRYKEAADEFREVIRVNPNDGYAYDNLGAALFEMRNYQEAETALRRVIQLTPQNSAAYHNLAAALENQGNREEAIRYYQEYLRLEPKIENRADIEKRIADLKGAERERLGYLLIKAGREGDATQINALLEKGADVNHIGDGGITPLAAVVEGGRLELVKLLLARGAKDDNGAAIAAAYEKGFTEIEQLLESTTAKPRSPESLSRVLLVAVRKGDIAKAEAMLTAGADEKDWALDSALDQKTVDNGMVRLLLDKGARVNSPEGERTPLMLASYAGNVEIVKLLLAKGANVNARGRLVNNDRTPLALAVEMDHVEVVKLLLAAGADAKDDWLLSLAASAPSLSYDDPRRKTLPRPSAEILKLLLHKGANAKSPAGDSALLSANSAEKVKLLLAHGANPNATGEYGRTPLMAAAYERDAESVAALLSAGANVNAKYSQGDTPLLQALNLGYQESKKRVRDPVGAVRALLRAKNIDVNAQNNNGETALMRAVRLGDAESVRLLLAARADVNSADVIGDTAFILAYDKGDTEIENLLARAAPQKPNPRTLNAFLVAAIKKKDPTKVKELLDKGADPNHKYLRGFGGIGYQETTPNIVLVLAAQVGHPGIVQMLLDKGADVNAKGLVRQRLDEKRGPIHGTALEAAKDPEVIEVLKRAMNKKN
jgi:ankyrin repeat protein/Flp pilus assembly protein TadD